ncbi:PRC-barrel domain-containing protein [Nakamurella endophytica]|uniref:PRC-barrel domain-containing protein n=1 Tax=Nakamurella endophytica TaxID=1748367 RepID=A0A917WJ54_9ACTN|nr:PRC-barrel domain-containing protein [Nakamurella endophytica]GGM07787.1 hypothetical protein GCM10011594_29690 [Nakamurella endophytica]
MLFTEGRGRKVVSTSSARQLGLVDGYVVDFSEQRVVALALSRTEGKARYLRWSDITAFGVDAVTVPADDVLLDSDPVLDDLHNKHHAILGKRVLTTHGVEVGTAQDVDLDPATGRLTALLTPADQIPGDRVLGAGSYAVVVRG